ncbi:NfeD family protein [Herminiimonas fonticola]|uniref:NfeD family protein n=1 Tax=Herminiimonas fonticola TaxID=303380 RepID=UPI00333EA8CE
MTDWMIWFAVACVLIILEMATGTFYLLMIAIGTAAGGIAALSGASGTWQCIVAAVLAAISTFALRRSRFGKSENLDASRDPGVNLDIGQTLEVAEWRNVAGAASTARVMYRGALWDVELASGGTAVAGQFRIQEVQGNRLIVINNNAAGN